MSSLAISALPCSVAQLSFGQPAATVAKSSLMTSLPSLRTRLSQEEFSSLFICLVSFQKIKMFLSFLRSVQDFMSFSELSTFGLCLEFIRLGGGAHPLFFCSFQCGSLSVSLGCVNGIVAVLGIFLPCSNVKLLSTNVEESAVKRKVRISKQEKKAKKRAFSIARALADKKISNRVPRKKCAVHLQCLPSGHHFFSQNKNKTELIIIDKSVGVVARVKTTASTVRRRAGGPVPLKAHVATSPFGVKYRCYVPVCPASVAFKNKLNRRVAVGDSIGEKKLAMRRLKVQRQVFNSRTPKKNRAVVVTTEKSSPEVSSTSFSIIFGSFTEPVTVVIPTVSVKLTPAPIPPPQSSVVCSAAPLSVAPKANGKVPTIPGSQPRTAGSSPPHAERVDEIVISGVVHEVLNKIKEGLLRYRVGGSMRFSRFFSSTHGCKIVANVRTNNSVWLNCIKGGGKKFSIAAPCTVDYVAMLRYVSGGKFPLVLMSREHYPDGRCYLAHLRYLCALYCRPFVETDFALGNWPTAARLVSLIRQRFGEDALNVKVKGFFTSHRVYHCDYDSYYSVTLRSLRGYIGGVAPPPSFMVSTVVVRNKESFSTLPKSVTFGSFTCEIRYVEPRMPRPAAVGVAPVMDDVANNPGTHHRGGASTKIFSGASHATFPAASVDRRFAHLILGSVQEVARKIAAGVLRFRVGGSMDFHHSFSTYNGYCFVVRRASNRSVHVSLYSPSDKLLRRDKIPCSDDYAAMMSYAAGGRFPLVLMTREKYKNGFCYLAHCRYACAFLLKGFVPSAFDIGARPTAAKLRSRLLAVLGEKSLAVKLYGLYTSRGVFHCDYDAAYIKDLRRMTAIIAGKEGEEGVIPSDITPAMKQKTIEAVYDRLYGSNDSLLKLSIEKDLIEFKNDVQSLKKDRPVVKVPFYMSEATQNALTRFYPQFDLKFSHSSHSDHPAAAASRLLENETLVRMCGNSVSDIGGCPLFHLNSKSQRRVHVCRPVLDGKDAQRRVVRDLQYSSVRAGDDEKLVEGPMNVDVCHYPLGVCDHESSAMMMVQVYDASLYEICSAMIKKKCRITYLTMVTPGEFLDGRECVYMESLDCDIEVDVHADTVMYKFGSSCYSHKLSNIKDIMTTPYVVLGGFLFSVEMYEIRMGVNYFKITKSEVCPYISSSKLLRYRRANSDVVKVKLPRFDKKRRMCLPGYDIIYLDSKFVSRVFDYVVCNCSAVNSKTFEWVWSFIKSSKSRVIISGRIIHKDVNLDLKYVESFAAVMLASGVRSRLASEYLAKNLSHFSGDCSFIEATSFVLREKIRNMTLNFNEQLLQLVKRVAFATLDVSFLDLDSTMESITEFAECRVTVELEALGCLRANAENEKIRSLAGDSIAAKLANEIVVDIESKHEPKRADESSGASDKKEVARPGLRGGSKPSILKEFLSFIMSSVSRLFGHLVDQQRFKSFIRLLDSAVSFVDCNHENLVFILRVLSKGYSCLLSFFTNRGDITSNLGEIVRVIRDVASHCANASISKAKILITFSAAMCAMMFNSCGFSGDSREYSSYLHRYIHVLFDTIFYEDSSYIPIEVLTSAICNAIVGLFSSGMSVSLNALLFQIAKGFSLEILVRNVLRVTHSLSTTAMEGVMRAVFSQIVSHVLIGNTGNSAYQVAFVTGVIPLMVRKCVSLIYTMREDTYSGFIKYGTSEFSFLSNILKFLKGRLVDELKSVVQGVFDSNRNIFRDVTQEAIHSTVMQLPGVVIDGLKRVAVKLHNRFFFRGNGSDGERSTCEEDEYFSCDESETPGLKGGSRCGFSILTFFSGIVWKARRFVREMKHKCFIKLFESLSRGLEKFKSLINRKIKGDVGIYDFLSAEIDDVFSSMNECDEIEDLLGNEYVANADEGPLDSEYFDFSEEFLASVNDLPYAGLRGGSRKTGVLALLHYIYNLFDCTSVVAYCGSNLSLLLSFLSSLIRRVGSTFAGREGIIVSVREFTQRLLRKRMRNLGLTNDYVVRSFANLVPSLLMKRVAESRLGGLLSTVRWASEVCSTSERRERFLALICLVGLSVPVFIRLLVAGMYRSANASLRRLYDRMSESFKKKCECLLEKFRRVIALFNRNDSASAGLKGGSPHLSFVRFMYFLIRFVVSSIWAGCGCVLSHHTLLFLSVSLVEDVNVLVKILGSFSFISQPIVSAILVTLLRPDFFVGCFSKVATASFFFLKVSPRIPLALKLQFEMLQNSALLKFIRRLLRLIAAKLKLRKKEGLRSRGGCHFRQRAVPVVPSGRSVEDDHERLSVKLQGVEALRSELRVLEELDSAVIEKLNRKRNRDNGDEEFSRPAHEVLRDATEFCTKANAVGVALERAVLVEDAVKSEKISRMAKAVVEKGVVSDKEIMPSLSDDEAVETAPAAEERDDSPKTVKVSDYLSRLNSNFEFPKPIVVDDNKDTGGLTNAVREFYYMQELALFEIHSKLCAYYDQLRIVEFDRSMAPCNEDAQLYVRKSGSTIVQGKDVRLNIKDFHDHDFLFDGKISVNKRRRSGSVLYHDNLSFLASNLFLAGYPFSRSFVFTNSSVDILLYEAPPGGGKTTTLIESFLKIFRKGEVSTMILTANKSSQVEILKKVEKEVSNIECQNRKDKRTPKKSIYTIDAYLMHHRGCKADVVFIDECFMVHAGSVLACIEFTRCHKVMIFGDSRQIHYIERNELDKCLYGDLDRFVDLECRVYGNVSYRCPWDVCAWLSTVYDNLIATVKSESEGKCSMRINEINSVDDLIPDVGSTYLCMLQSEKLEISKHFIRKGVSKLNVLTVHEAQGETYARVNLVRLKFQEDEPFKSIRHITVALSRHTDSLTYNVLASRRGDATCDAIQKAKELVNKFRVFPTSFGGSVLNLDIKKDVEDNSRCKASSAPLSVINDFLNDVNPGTTVIEFGDLSADFSTGPFECGASGIVVRDNISSSSITDHDKQRV
uniref:Polyprotein n=1 Tax=Grapevine leafroll-associated virus 2 TaxID=64003 RepID=A0A4D6E9R6_9CLOS|nr:polyprotein [Grapevine leafroll-associated virus 2]